MRVATAEVAIKPDFSGFKQQLRAGLRAAANGESVDVTVDVDTRAAARQLKAAFRDQRVNVDVDVDQKPLRRFADDIRDVKTSLGELNKPAKFAALTVGLVGAAGGAASLGSALGVAAGAAIALAPTLLAAGQGLGVVKLATSGVSDALKASSKGAKEYQEALKAVAPAARPFVDFLVSLKPELKNLQNIAAKGLFPGVQSALEGLTKKYLPTFKLAVFDTASALGDLARKGGELATSGPFSRSLQALIENNSRIIRQGGTAVLSLADAFVTVSAAAIPLTNHLVDLAVRGAGRLNQAIKDAKASGGLAAFFREAQVAIDNVLRVIGNVGHALGGVFKAALPSGQQLLAAIEGITRRFAEWTNSRGGQEAMRKFFADIRTFALGVLSALEKSGPALGAYLKSTAALAAVVGKLADEHPAILQLALALIAVNKTLPGIVAVTSAVKGLRTLITTPVPSAGLSGGLVNLGAAGVAAAAVFATLKYNVDQFKKGGLENGKFLDPATLALKTLGGWLGITKDKTAQVTTATKAGSDAQKGHANAVKAATDAMRANKAQMDSLKVSALALFDAETSLKQAKLNLNTAQKEVTRLQKEGKTKTDEYKQATLNLRSAQSGVVAAKSGFVAAIDAQKDAIKKSKDVTVEQVTGLISMYKKLGVKPPKDLVEFLKDLKAKVDALKDKTFTLTAKGLVALPGGGATYASANRNRGGPIPGTGNRDTVPAMLTPGEFVIRKRAVQSIGLDNLRRMNAMNSGGLVDEPQRFAIGGLVMGQKGEGGAKFGADLKAFYNSVYMTVAKQGDAAMKAYLASLERSGGGGGTAGGAAGIKSFIKGTDPLPYIWGGVGPRGYDCSGLTGEVYNRMRGRPSFRRVFTTASNFRSLGFKPGKGGTYSIGVNPGKHMAGEYGGLRFEAESTKTGIKIGSAASSVGSFPVQFHLARGGLVGDLNALAKLAGFDLGGDPGGIRFRVNGRLPDGSKRGTPVGVFHQGGYVGRDQLALLQRGERVLSAAQERARGAGVPAMAGALTIAVDARGSSDPIAVEVAARRGAEAALSAYRQSRTIRPRR